MHLGATRALGYTVLLLLSKVRIPQRQDLWGHKKDSQTILHHHRDLTREEPTFLLALPIFERTVSISTTSHVLEMPTILQIVAVGSYAISTGTLALTPPPGAHIQTCYEGETSALHCYNGEGDTPQDVSVEDVAYVGAKLREWGRGADGGRFLTMPAENTPDCAEWSIFTYQSVLALAKHIDPNVHTSVLYEDIARTVDGGESASDEDKAKAIIGCEKSGGSLGVLVNETDPAYHTEDYKRAGYTPQGIIIKIVSNVPKEEL